MPGKLRLLLGLLCLLYLLLPFPAAAQDESPNPLFNADENLLVVGEGVSLDEEAIAEAAQPLLEMGAGVVIFMTEEGNVADFDSLLRDNNWMQGIEVADNLVAIFVSVEEREWEIRYGDDYVSALRPRSEGIGSGTLGPNLRDGNYTLAFVRSLEALTEAISSAPAVAEGGGVSSAPVSSFPTSVPYQSQPYSFPSSSSGGSSSSSDGDGFPFWTLCIVGAIMIFNFIRNPASLFEGSGGGYNSRPRYKSSWTSSGRRSGGGFSSHSSSRSFGRGGSSRGKW